MVQLLLAKGARPTAGGTTSVSVLALACERGDSGIVNALLDAGAIVSADQADGLTPVSLCAGHSSAAVVQRLLAAGALVDLPDDSGQTPLMWAAAYGRVETLRLLIQRGAQVNRVSRQGFSPLFFALKSGNPEAPLALLQAGGDAAHVAPDGTSAVQLAMYQHDYGFAALMVERGADLTALDRNGYALLHAAVLAEQPQLVKLLLAKGALANALTGPSRVKRRFEVNFKVGDYETPTRSPLLLAAELGAAALMQELVDAGADPAFRAQDGATLVLAAVTSGKRAALALALQLSPDANVTTPDGQTPLHLLLSGDVGPETGDMLRLLADKGARVDIKSQQGQTAVDVGRASLAAMKSLFVASFGARAN